MSMNRTTYLIAGYDLTNYKTYKYEDWSWTDEGEKYRYYTKKGNIQLFDDPMNGSYLYLGYILAKITDNGYYGEEIINPEYVSEIMPDVSHKLLDLESKGIISKCPRLGFDYKIIVFEEWS